jgi:hypothetical protein
MKVNGSVMDAATRRPIGGARVRIGNRVTYTNPVGVYVLKVHDSASATLDVSAPGYQATTSECSTPATRRPVCDIELAPLKTH